MNVLQHIANKLNEEEERLKDDMAQGGIKDFGAYQNATGVIRGLRMAKMHILETAKAIEDED